MKTALIQAAHKAILAMTSQRETIPDAVKALQEALSHPELKPMVTKRENSIILHEGWDKLPSETKLYAEFQHSKE